MTDRRKLAEMLKDEIETMLANDDHGDVVRLLFNLTADWSDEQVESELAIRLD